MEKGLCPRGEDQRPLAAAEAQGPFLRGEGRQKFPPGDGRDGPGVLLRQMGGDPRQDAPGDQGQDPAEAGEGVPGVPAEPFQKSPFPGRGEGEGAAFRGNLPLEVLSCRPVHPDEDRDGGFLRAGRGGEALQIELCRDSGVVHQGDALVTPGLPLPGHPALGAFRPAEDQGGGVPFLPGPIAGGGRQGLQGALGVGQGLPAVHLVQAEVPGPVVVVFPGGPQVPEPEEIRPAFPKGHFPGQDPPDGVQGLLAKASLHTNTPFKKGGPTGPPAGYPKGSWPL